MIQFTIPLAPISKKNSQRILWRWAKDRSTGRQKRTPYIAPSEAFENYQESALWFVPKGKHINEPVNVKCLFYMPDRRKVDLTNLLEAVDDIMVTAGLLADDNYTIVESHDGSRVLYDKDKPRTEIYIECPFNEREGRERNCAD